MGLSIAGQAFAVVYSRENGETFDESIVVITAADALSFRAVQLLTGEGDYHVQA